LYLANKINSFVLLLQDILLQHFAGTPLSKVVIHLELDFLRGLIDKLDEIPQQLKPLIERDNAPNFHHPVGKVTSTMRAIIKQMWGHPYQGAIASMYLEAKVLELLALQLAQFLESSSDTVETTLKSQSIDRIYQARDILATHLENPPSISKLTQQVGLCDRTLRRGFRELFGTTVIGYLTSLRMEQAEKQLREGKLSISEIANLVGYSNLSYFAAAFKRQFGITPSECLAGQKVFK
ncbi:MAG: AraC family transcriptional regulator, partial [Cyanobacteria bacterium J06638_38]